MNKKHKVPLTWRLAQGTCGAYFGSRCDDPKFHFVSKSVCCVPATKSLTLVKKLQLS